MQTSITQRADITALALLLDRLTPGLYTPQPGEMPSETAARWDAARDITDDLLAEIAAAATVPCPTCCGTGISRSGTCATCNGTGEVAW